MSRPHGGRSQSTGSMDDLLLYRAIKDQATSSEQVAVDAWRRLTPVNEARYQELRAILEATMHAMHASRVTSEPPPILEVLELAARREASNTRHVRTRRI